MEFSLRIPKNFEQLPTEADLQLRSHTQSTHNSFSDFFRFENDGHTCYVLCGQIYGERQTPLRELALRSESLQGRFVLVRWSAQEKSLHIFLDKYRLLNPLISQDEDYFYIANILAGLPAKHLQNLLPVAEQSLRVLGAIPYPLTLFSDIQFLSGTLLWKSGHLQIADNSEAWPNEDEGANTATWITVFEKTVENLFTHWPLTHFRLSGGVDTRLLSFLIPKSFHGSLKTQVLCHPRLKLEEDRDVLGAKLVAELFDFDLEIIQPQPERYGFLGNVTPFSGLYGGEFLGGLLFQFSPLKDFLTNPDAISDSGVKKLWLTRLAKLGARKLTTEIFLSGFRSTIYKSINKSWATPWRMNLMCLSPFVEQAVLDLLLSTPFDETLNYKLYVKIYRALVGDSSHLPLSSPIVDLQDLPRFTEGLDPKSLQPPTEPAQGVGTLGDQNLANFLARNAALINP